jgi:hypothetical protein
MGLGVWVIVALKRRPGTAVGTVLGEGLALGHGEAAMTTSSNFFDYEAHIKSSALLLPHPSQTLNTPRRCRRRRSRLRAKAAGRGGGLSLLPRWDGDRDPLTLATAGRIW